MSLPGPGGIAPPPGTASSNALSLLKRQNAQRLEQIDRQIMMIEAAILLQLVEADESLADRFAILISIPGVSNITAFALLMRNAGARGLPRSRPGRQPRRPGADRPTARALDRFAHSFAAVAPTSAKRSTCRPSSPLASIQT